MKLCFRFRQSKSPVYCCYVMHYNWWRTNISKDSPDVDYHLKTKTLIYHESAEFCPGYHVQEETRIIGQDAFSLLRLQK